jgi:hypothetical protein
VTFDELFAKYQKLSEDPERRNLEADRASHERDEYKKLYELVSLELERTRRHLASTGLARRACRC